MDVINIGFVYVQADFSWLLWWGLKQWLNILAVSHWYLWNILGKPFQNKWHVES